jgi:signal transduction histidine kinase
LVRLDRHLRVVGEIAVAAREDHDLDELLRRLCASVARGLGFERVAICRYDAERDEVEHLVAYGIEDEVLRRLPVSLDAYPIIRRAFATRDIVFVDDARAEGQLASAVADDLGITCAFTVPLLAGARCLGTVGGDRAGRPFTLDETARQMLMTASLVAATLLDADSPTGPRLDALAAQLLDVSRLDAGEVAIAPECIRLRARVDELLAVVAPEAGVVVDIPPELEATADAPAFDRIVTHLLGNAALYGAPPIRVGAAEGETSVAVVVEDAGRGVEPAFAPLLFDRFTRSGPSTLAVAGGAGLGLAISRGLALAQGGDLTFEPARPNGSRFVLTLPR